MESKCPKLPVVLILHITKFAEFGGLALMISCKEYNNAIENYKYWDPLSLMFDQISIRNIRFQTPKLTVRNMDQFEQIKKHHNVKELWMWFFGAEEKPHFSQIPSSVTSVDLSSAFESGSSIKYLPHHVTALTVESHIPDIEEHLPDTINYLKVRKTYKSRDVIIQRWPKNLTHLDLSGYQGKYREETMAKIGELTELKVLYASEYSDELVKVPESVTVLEAWWISDKSIISIEKLPHLTSLSVVNVQGGLPLLSNKLRVFNAISGFDLEIDCLPDSVEIIDLSYQFNKPIKKLPKSLVHIRFGYQFDNKLPEFPQTTKRIEFKTKFNKPLTVPDTLTHLVLGKNFNRVLEVRSEGKLVSGWPQFLISLEIHNPQFKLKLNGIPKTIKTIYAWNPLYNKLALLYGDSVKNLND